MDLTNIFLIYSNLVYCVKNKGTVNTISLNYPIIIDIITIRICGISFLLTLRDWLS